MTRTGTSGAVRSKGLQNNQAAGVAAPVLNQAALTENMTIVAHGSADTTTNPPVNWTERHDNTFTNPTIALETATRDSGFTGTTITFNNTSSTTFCSHALELDSTTAASEISGTASLVFGEGSSTLAGIGALAGVAALVLAGTGVGTANAEIAGTAALTTTASGTPFRRITQLFPFGYPGPRYGDFYRPPGRVAGSAALVFGASFRPNQTVEIAGTAALTFAGRGGIPRWTSQLLPHMWPGRRYGEFARTSLSQISGTAALVVGGAGLLTGSAEIVGQADLAFTNTGTLAGTGALAGTSTLTVGASGLLDLPSGQIVGTAALTLGGTGALAGQGALATSTPLVLTGIGSAQAVGVLTGTSSVVLTATGLLDLPSGQMVGTAALQFGATATLYPVDLLNELGAYYRLDNNLLDSSGNVQHLTEVDPIDYGPGKLNSGMVGSIAASLGEPVARRTGMTSIGDAAASIAFWAKTDMQGVGEGPHAGFRNTGLANWNLQLDLSDRFFQASVSYKTAAGFSSFVTGPIIPADTFVHLVATYDGSVLRLYVNGAFIAQATDAALPVGWHLDVFEITAETTGLASVLDEVGVWGRVLTDAEIEVLYNGGDGFDPTTGSIINRVVFTGTVVTRRVFEGVVKLRHVFEEV